VLGTVSYFLVFFLPTNKVPFAPQWRVDFKMGFGYKSAVILCSWTQSFQEHVMLCFMFNLSFEVFFLFFLVFFRVALATCPKAFFSLSFLVAA
jgi:hypothetical protein